MSKEDLLNYLRDEGQVKFEEVTSDVGASMGSQDFSVHVLPGGENYREVVLTMADPKVPEYHKVVELNDGTFEVTDPDSYGIPMDNRDDAESQARYMNEKRLGGTPTAYTSSHFPDIPNYVAHMRTNERVDASGKQGLFIEEIQSDRHQAGRKQGYTPEKPTKQDWQRWDDEVSGIMPENRTADQQVIADKIDAWSERDSRIADAPFRTTWPLQIFKRALRDAVDGGKDWIGWTDGATQNARFDLSKSVDSLEYIKSEDGTFKINGYKNNNQIVSQAAILEKDLPNVVGKDVAERIIEKSKVNNIDILEGGDLQVGGSGMKGFYDNMMPKEIGKYVKQWGGKVEQSGIPSKTTKEGKISYSELEKLNDKDYETVMAGKTINDTPIWRIEITPEMRKIAETGQSRFMPKSRKKQSGEVRRSTFEVSQKQPKNNKDLANSISLLLSGAASRQMQREDK